MEMSRKENEAVVNRFLLSTLFWVILEFSFYILNSLFNNYRTFRYFTPFTYALMIIGLIGLITMIALACMKKIKISNAVYYGIIFVIVLITGVFVKFFYMLPFGLAEMFDNVATRFKVMGLLVALIYIYEIVRYFLNVNK
jgi:hypothetical protein